MEYNWIDPPLLEITPWFNLSTQRCVAVCTYPTNPVRHVSSIIFLYFYFFFCPIFIQFEEHQMKCVYKSLHAAIYLAFDLYSFHSFLIFFFFCKWEKIYHWNLKIRKKKWIHREIVWSGPLLLIQDAIFAWSWCSGNLIYREATPIFSQPL